MFAKIKFKSLSYVIMGIFGVEVWIHGIHAGIYTNTNVKMLSMYVILTTYIHGKGKKIVAVELEYGGCSWISYVLPQVC